MTASKLKQITITPYTRRDRHIVSDLLFRHYNVHTHLDWQETEKWLETQQGVTRLAWDHGRLIGALATSAPMDHTTWIRIAALADQANPAPTFDALWKSVREDLIATDTRLVALLLIRDWLTPFITAHGFTLEEEVVTLRRADLPMLDESIPPRLIIRPIRDGEIPIIARVDQAAFAPPWQLSDDDVREAVRAAAYSTVAVSGERIVGYQASTMYFDGGHLARLAVHPDAQGTGVGAALVADLLRRFARRGISAVTVNTQLSNTRSQRLYERFGFRRNGYDLPVWMLRL